MKIQRIRDPLHNLIQFYTKQELERVLWKVLQTRPFQRLRRVKQLGFSDLVYPGASHSRFAHSIGVFHTARQLMDVVRKRGGEEQTTRENCALAAALVHDLGHGPFSHSFETIGKRLGLRLADHELMSDFLVRDGEIAEILNEMGSGFASDVADIIKKEGRKTVHNAVVSSQFDADRLDYMRRDRLMTGTQHAAIDFEWLIANLDIDNVPTGVDERQVGEIATFVIGPKAVPAAEGFVLGLFQLYPTVYFHKATRGAERIFTELLVRLVTLVKDDEIASTGLTDTHPLVRFAIEPENFDVALNLDDTVVWGALSMMAGAPDPLIGEFASRLRDRRLFKSVDIRTKVTHEFDPNASDAPESVDRIDRCCAAINEKLLDIVEEQTSEALRILIDDAERSPYKNRDEVSTSMEQIHVKTEGGELVDLKQRSRVVAALSTYKLFRAYVREDDHEMRQRIYSIIEDEVKRCQ